MSHDFLLWASALGIFFAGFALGVAVMIVHAAMMSRELLVPQELVPKVVEVPLPPVWGPSTESPFMPKAAKLKTVRQPASAETKGAYLDEFNRLLVTRREGKPVAAAASEPPLQPPSITRLPSIWTRE